jgi:DNA replicative helicase MCM subunit Mcm2 (Cdc46/Mcm family)
VCSRPKGPDDGSDKCPLDPYFVVHEKSQFIDQQVLKLQEAPDDVPVGELPRHILVSADRYLANRVVPGSRCTVMGVFSIYNSQKNSKNSGAVAIRNPYLRAVGIQTDVSHNQGGATMQFTEEEEQEFLEMSRRPDLYELFSSCIAPSIFGNADIKKAVTCLLMGGSKKILPDGMRLRGDINVLLLGDPGTAKSQWTKAFSEVGIKSEKGERALLRDAETFDAKLSKVEEFGEVGKEVVAAVKKRVGYVEEVKVEEKQVEKKEDEKTPPVENGNAKSENEELETGKRGGEDW